MLEYVILNTGSNGNCLIFNKYMAIDMGVSYKQIKSYLKEIKIVLLTHIHGDHFNKTCIKRIAFEKPTTKWICREWLVDELLELGVNKKNIYVLKDKKTYDLGKFLITPIETYHDVRNTSYKIDFKPITIYYATDTSHLDNLDCLKKLDYYFIESNYNEEILKQHILECTDEGQLKYLSRVSETHLSYEQCNSFLIDNMGDNSKYVYLHASKFNFKEE